MMADEGEKVEFRLPDWFNRKHFNYLHAAFVTIYITRDLIKIGLVLKNMIVTRKYAHPPDIYEIPGGATSMNSWRELRHSVAGESQFILLDAIIDINLNVAKFITDYYPYLWGKTALYASTKMSRAVWFTAFDFFVNELGRFIPSVFVDAFSEQSHTLRTELFSAIPSLVMRITLLYFSVLVFNALGFKLVIVELLLYRIIRVVMLHPLLLPATTMRQALEQQLPGVVEIMNLAMSLGFPTECIVLDQGGSRPPQASFYNFLLYDRLVITRNLFIAMEPEQAVGVVAHELCHWKYCHGYINHMCRFLLNCTKLYFYMVAYEDPRFAAFFGLEDTHPIIPLMLAFSTVWPVFHDVAYGLGNLFNASLELMCDDFACKLTDPKRYREALVKMAPYREFYPFDGWFSSWFHGMPSLLTRIQRVDKRIKKASAMSINKHSPYIMSSDINHFACHYKKFLIRSGEIS